MLHASHALVPVMVDGELRWAIVESEQLEIIDDWDVAAMAATGSVTIVATDAIIPEKRTLSFQEMMSATDHDGVFHEEEEGGADLPDNFASRLWIPPELRLSDRHLADG